MKINKYIFIICVFSVFFKLSYGTGGVYTSTGLSSVWNSTTSWTHTSDPTSPGIPGSDDDVVIQNGHTINGSSNISVRNITINSGGTFATGSYAIYIYGNFSNAGTVTISGTLWVFSGSGTIGSTVPISPAGTWGIQITPDGGTRNFTSGTTISCTYIKGLGSLGGTINNRGNITISNSSSGLSLDYVTFNNVANSTLTISKNITRTNGASFQASGVPNTVSYTGTTWTNLGSNTATTTYYNLTLDNGAGVTVGTKTLSGSIIVSNSITLASNIQLDCNSKDITCNGTWQNNGTTAANNLSNTGGTFTFGGASPNILRKTLQEIFGNVVLNSTGTLSLNSSNTAGYTGSFQCNNLTLTAGILDFNSTGNYTVTVKGNMATNGGTLNQQTSGLIQFTGTTAQTIGGTAILTFDAITISNAAGVSTTSMEKLSSKGTLTVSSGTFTSNTADFIIVSDATTSATGRIAPLTSGSVAGSKWRVQRRILTTGSSSTNPYWGDYSSPVTSATLSDWDNEMYLSGCGGADGNASSGGGIFYSVKQWEGTASDVNVTSLVTLTPGKGFAIWTADNLTTLSDFTFDTHGTPNQGNVTHNCAAAGYYRMGNPYPSQILWSSLTRTNVEDGFFCNDETLNDYAVWDGSTGSGTGKLNGTGGIINSSQGFVVHATAAGSLKFTETAKTSSINNVFNKTNPKLDNYIRFHFSNGQRQLGMESKICFADGANNQADEMDMLYPPLFFENQKRNIVKTLTTMGDALCKNTLNLSDISHEVPVVFQPAEPGNFTINVEDIPNFTSYNCVFLEDISAGKFIDLKSQNTYSFAMPNVTERRFVFHFKRTDGSAEACVTPSSIFKTIAANMPIAKVFLNETGITLNFETNQEITKVKVVIYNALGEIISNTEGYYSGGQYVIPKPEVQGIYLVNLNDGTKSETHRVFVD